MDNPAAVGFGNRFDDLEYEWQDARCRHPKGRFEVLVKTATFDEGHGNKERAFRGAAAIDDSDDVGVVEGGEDACLALEACTAA